MESNIIAKIVVFHIIRFAANIHKSREYFLPSGTITNFDEISIDVGQCFEPAFGVFNAPQNGGYLFGFDGTDVRPAEPTAIWLRVNNADYNQFRYDGDIASLKPWFREINGVAIISLRGGDRVILCNDWQC